MHHCTVIYFFLKVYVNSKVIWNPNLEPNSHVIRLLKRVILRRVLSAPTVVTKLNIKAKILESGKLFWSSQVLKD